VELAGIEPAASSLRKMASANLPRVWCGLHSQTRSKTVQMGHFQVCRESCLNSFSGLHPMVADVRQRARTVGRTPQPPVQREKPAGGF
jgi:hypothetical protein